MVGLNLVCYARDYLVYVSTSMDESVAVSYVCRSCLLLFMGFKSLVDLVIFNMLDFNIVLGMT